MGNQIQLEEALDTSDLSKASFGPQKKTSGPRTESDDFKELCFTVPREIEAKFFITRVALEKEVNLGKLTHQRISQSFIPRSLLAEAVRLVKEEGILKSMPDEMPFDVSYARIRRVKQEGERSYFFTIKGRKDSNLARPEVEVEIPKSLYRELTALAIDGTIKKDRYLLAGSTWNENNRRSALSKGAEIDIITHLGQGDNFRKLRSSETQFALVDVEFHSASQRDDFLDGHHTLRFLKRAGIELSPSDKDNSKFLTMRYLARSGIDRRVLEAVEELSGIYKKKAA